MYIFLAELLLRMLAERLLFQDRWEMCPQELSDFHWMVASQILFMFTSKSGEDFQFDEYFSKG